MRYSSRKCACRRELNSHDAAEPREVGHLSLQLQSKWSLSKARSEPIYTTVWSIKRGAEIGSGSLQLKDMGPPCHINPPVCVGRAGFQSVRRAAAISSAASARAREAA